MKTTEFETVNPSEDISPGFMRSIYICRVIHVISPFAEAGIVNTFDT